MDGRRIGPGNMMTKAASVAFLAAVALAGCQTKPKPPPSPHAYLHPPEVPHLLAELPKAK